jgi:hypothetical protein
VSEIATHSDKEDFTMISATEFAERLKISIGTVRNWIRNGTLKPGRDYIKIRRIYRIIWGGELLRQMKENTCREFEKRPRMHNNRNNKQMIKLRA